jgi:hypothetical protein
MNAILCIKGNIVQKAASYGRLFFYLWQGINISLLYAKLDPLITGISRYREGSAGLKTFWNSPPE